MRPLRGIHDPKLGDREELLGADVIVPHRMLKNHVIEQTGINSYALFSVAAANALELQRLCEPLTPYKEAYEHIGEVNMLVHDLKSAWDREEERKKIIVDENDPWIKIEVDVPFPLSVVWGADHYARAGRPVAWAELRQTRG
ncbi:MAG: DUF2652 domain-containing protein [Anaerolineales bacterium]